MRLALVSDIHGNLTPLEAVLTDLRQTSPDVIYHGGDLADMGSRPSEVARAKRLCHGRTRWKEFAGQSSALPAWRGVDCCGQAASLGCRLPRARMRKMPR
jgi:3',5'-cyclic AMP phosphodiesterase CpdA